MANELDRLSALRAAYAGLERPVEAGAPWPLAEMFGAEPEAAWGPRELLAHVAEMLPFWLGELEKVVEGATDGSAVPFGRVATDAVRIGLIERDRTLPLRVLFGRIDAGIRAWSERLETLTDEERARVGRHPKLGEMSPPAFLERFILGHAEEHVVQLEGIIAAGPRDSA
ncbi:MAG TPA: DinB family protein [Methylomirabilota bacterium]|nr:DinB family protein [Methylomirabilota bacterium]